MIKYITIIKNQDIYKRYSRFGDYPLMESLVQCQSAHELNGLSKEVMMLIPTIPPLVAITAQAAIANK